MFKTKITSALLATTLLLSPLSATENLALQKKADELRESGHTLEAINLYNHLIVTYQEKGDYNSLFSTMIGRFLSWKHLFYKTGDSVYSTFVKKEAEAMLQIAKDHQLQDKMYLIHFLNGTSSILVKDYVSAEEEFRQAVTLYPEDNAEKGDWTAHLGEAIFRNGNHKEGQGMILKGVKQMQDKSADVDSFLINVWISGAYLRLSKLLKPFDEAESLVYLNKAKSIIDSDERLVIRKRQFEAFLQEWEKI